MRGHDDILPFHFIMNDPAGNSFVRNEFFPAADPNLKVEKYSRTIEQIVSMGYNPENAEISKTEEDQNNATRNKFEEFQTKAKGDDQSSKYSKKDTEKMIQKMQDIKKNVHYSAHKTDFTKPLETTDIEGSPLLKNRRSCGVRDHVHELRQTGIHEDVSMLHPLFQGPHSDGLHLRPLSPPNHRDQNRRRYLTPSHQIHNEN